MSSSKTTVTPSLADSKDTCYNQQNIRGYE